MTQGEEAFKSWDAEKKTIRYRYWSALRKVAIEYYAIAGGPDPDGLGPYLLETYGINMNLTTNSMITAEYTIADEKKYSIFLLKFLS